VSCNVLTPKKKKKKKKMVRSMAKDRIIFCNGELISEIQPEISENDVAGDSDWSRTIRSTTFVLSHVFRGA